MSDLHRLPQPPDEKTSTKLHKLKQKHNNISIQVIVQEYTSQTGTSGRACVRACVRARVCVCVNTHNLGRVTFSFVTEQNPTLVAQVPYLETL